jgi:hypothetical protein
VKYKTTLTPQTEANQTVRLDLSTKDGVQSMRIGLTDQRLTAHGGLVVWTRFVKESGLREKLAAALPHAPTNPNAYDPVDTALDTGPKCGAVVARPAPAAAIAATSAPLLVGTGNVTPRLALPRRRGA